jgi:hypothetical protein
MAKPIPAFEPSISEEAHSASKKVVDEQDHLSGREDERDVLVKTMSNLNKQHVCLSVCLPVYLSFCPSVSVCSFLLLPL